MANSDPVASAKLELDLSSWNSQWDAAFSDTEALQSALDDLSGQSIDIEFNMDDSGLADIESLDGQTISPAIETTESDDTKKMVEGITFLALKEKIKLAFDIIGNVWDFFMKIEGIVVEPFLDVGDAVARINAQTGGTGLADTAQFIRDIQAADLGTSVDQIADVVIAAKQLGAPIDEATRATLTFTHTWTEENPETVLKSLNTLVETGLVPNLQAASDLMTVFFQEGGNKAQDALNVVEANAQSWSDMGLNGTQALSAVNSLLDSGVDSATDAAKMIQTLDDALTAAAANADSPQAEAIKNLGLTNPKDSGAAMGADFIDGFAGAFATLPSDQQDLVSGVLFGKGGKKFTGALAGLTTQGGPFADVVGAAADAATEIDNSLRGAIDDFVLAINTSITDLLASDKIDLDGFIERLKKGFQAAVGVLTGGGTIGEALEIGFNIQGFDTTVANLERIFGNFEIILLQAISAIQHLQGIDNTEINKQIASLAKGQLSFDLQIANESEIPGLINTALSRGVGGSDIDNAIFTAFRESFEKGDFSGAFDIAQGFKDTLTKKGIDSTVADTMIAQLTSQLNTSLNDALTSGDFTLAQTLGEALKIDPAELATAIQDAQNALSEAFAPKQRTGGLFDMSSVTGGADPLGETFAKRMGMDTLAADVQTATSDATTAITDMQTSVNTSLTATAADFANTTVAAQLMDTDIAAAMTGNTVTASFEAVAASAEAEFPIVVRWFKKLEAETLQWDVGVSILTLKLGGLAAAVNNLPWERLGQLQSISVPVGMGGGGGGTTNNTTVVVNTTNNVQSNAQAAANGYAISSSIRGQGGNR